MDVLGAAGDIGSAGVIRWLLNRFQFSTLLAETRQMQKSNFLQSELQSGSKDAKAIFHAAAKVDRRSFLEILCGAGNLSNAEAEVNALG